MTPGPCMSPSVKVWPGAIETDGETFQPRPRSRAACAPVPSVARAPAPGAPDKFSGLIDRDLAFERRASCSRPCITRLLSGGHAEDAVARVDHENVAGHVACQWAAEVQGRVADIVGADVAPQRRIAFGVVFHHREAG